MGRIDEISGQAAQQYLNGDKEGAIKTLERATILGDNAHIYIGLGTFYYDAKRYEEAIEVLERAKSINPQSLDAKVILQIAYRAVEKFEKAREIQYEILEEDPTHVCANVGLGITSIMLEEYETAEWVLLGVINRGIPKPKNKLWKIWDQEKRYKQQIDQLDKEAFFDAFTHLYELYTAMGRKDEATKIGLGYLTSVIKSKFSLIRQIV